MSEKEIAEEFADLDQKGASIKMAMSQDYPVRTKDSLSIRLMKNLKEISPISN